MGELQYRHLPKYNIGAQFLTARSCNNTPYFRVPACANLFCEELEAARLRYGFHFLAFVVMPDHVHLLLWWDTDRLPELTISQVAYPEAPLRPTREPPNRPRRRNWRYPIWQPGAGYYFNVYTERKLLEKIAYIHANPVQAGLAARPEDYPWSSGHVDAGRLAPHSVTITPYTEILW